MQPLRSVEQAGEVLGISKWTVRSYIKTGKLKPVRLGRRVLIEEAELERFVASGKAPLGNVEQLDAVGSAVEHVGGNHDQDNA